MMAPVRARRWLTIVFVALVTSGCWVEVGANAQRTAFVAGEKTLTTTNVKSLRLAWTVKVPTQPGSPVIGNGVLFVAGGATMTAFATQDGAQLWQTGPMSQGSTTQMADTAIVNNKVLAPYSLFNAGGTFTFDPAKGTYTSSAVSATIPYNAPVVDGKTVAMTRKEVRTDGTLSSLSYGSRVGLINFWSNSAQAVPATTPMINGHTIFVGSGTSVLAFSLDTCPASPIAGLCAPLWKKDLKSTTSMPVAISSTRVAVATQVGSIFVLDAATGAQEFVALTTSSYAQPPAIDNSGLMYTATVDGVVRAFPTAGCNFPTCAAVWSSKQKGPITTQLVTAGGVVYAGTATGRVLAFDAKGCAKPPCTWLFTVTVDSKAQRVQLIEDAGTLYAVTDTGLVSAYRPPAPPATTTTTTKATTKAS